MPRRFNDDIIHDVLPHFGAHELFDLAFYSGVLLDCVRRDQKNLAIKKYSEITITSGEEGICDLKIVGHAYPWDARETHTTPPMALSAAMRQLSDFSRRSDVFDGSTFDVLTIDYVKLGPIFFDNLETALAHSTVKHVVFRDCLTRGVMKTRLVRFFERLTGLEQVSFEDMRTTSTFFDNVFVSDVNAAGVLQLRMMMQPPDDELHNVTLEACLGSVFAVAHVGAPRLRKLTVCGVDDMDTDVLAKMFSAVTACAHRDPIELSLWPIEHYRQIVPPALSQYFDQAQSSPARRFYVVPATVAPGGLAVTIICKRDRSAVSLIRG